MKSKDTTWNLTWMNLTIRGIASNLGSRNADSFRQDSRYFLTATQRKWANHNR